MGILVPGRPGPRRDRVWGVSGFMGGEERQARAGFRLTQRSVGRSGGDRPGGAADREVAQGGHDLGAGGGADAAGVFGEGHVAAPVERFDLPVGAGQGTELLRAGVVSGLAAERVDEFGARVAAGQVGGVPLHDLGRRAALPARDGRDAAIAAALDELVEAAAALTETPPSASSGTRWHESGNPAAASSAAEGRASL
jgi:hypothetical protein